jgi:predicted DNA repair protein MutK
MTTVAAKKTAGVLGDDLALNAEQVSGVRAERELPVVWAVAKGSAINKAILVPAALLISALIPWAITPLLMLGGLFLCYEGVEKVAHKFLHRQEVEKQHVETLKAIADPAVDLVAFEKQRIRGAVRTDFILSAEIIVITLGTVQQAPFMKQVSVLVAIAVLMTIGVYGLVAGIVKLDDAGLHLLERGRNAGSRFYSGIGRGLLLFAPKLMKFLSVAGTIAMFTVGGGILVHGIATLEHFQHDLLLQFSDAGALHATARFTTPVLISITVGIVSGAAVLAGIGMINKLRGRFTAQSPD